MPDPIASQTPDELVMEDFVFGGIETDEAHLLAAQRELLHGIRHQYQMEPLDPAPEQPVKLTVTVGPDVALDQLTAHVMAAYSGRSAGSCEDEANPTPHTFSVDFVWQEARWEPLIWSFVDVWQATIPGQPLGTYLQYRIEGCLKGSHQSWWASEPHIDGTVESQTVYGYFVDQFTPPHWAYEAVVYQIFVDRFGGVQDRWLAAEEMNDFVGGTLADVIEKLPYIAALGASAIWLTPLFVCESYHGYDTIDYYNVDPRFGTNAELHHLVQEAHQLGMRVLLDFVANHTGVGFKPFVEALQNPNSPFRSWFCVGSEYTHGYRCFFDVAAMPQLNTDEPAVRRFLCDAAIHWLTDYHVDGFRLDYAAGPSHAFWSEFYAACKMAKPDCWLFGEVTRPGEALRTYAGRLDGCLDFGLTRLLRQLCAAGSPAVSLVEFANYIVRNQRFFQAPGTNGFMLPSFLDNHDMNRFLWTVGNDKARLKMAATLLFALGGPPILYYGTEVGLSQPRSKAPWMEEARHPMLWGDGQDGELLDFFKRLIALRRSQPALWHGAIESLYINRERALWLAERSHSESLILIGVNGSIERQAVDLPTGSFVGLAGERVQRQAMLEPMSAAIFYKEG